MTPPRESVELSQIIQGDVFSGGNDGEGHDSDNGASLGCIKAGEPESRASRKATSGQPAKCRNAGELLELSDVPLDILDEVSYRTSSVADDKMHDPPGTNRYSLFSTQ